MLSRGKEMQTELKAEAIRQHPPHPQHLDHLYSTLQVALPLNDEYKPLKARVGKAAKVWHSLDLDVHAGDGAAGALGLATSVSPSLQEYPFVLDPFQREAILCIDNNESVLVSAHTSAGKTVCAEWVNGIECIHLFMSSCLHVQKKETRDIMQNNKKKERKMHNIY